jgi:hypothetical protein
VGSNLLTVAGGRLDALRSHFGDRWPRVSAPAVVFLVVAPFAVPLIQLELNFPLFGDTAYMQYTAWCIRHGMKLYRDMGSADGPFIHFAQAAIQVVLGTSDRALRIGDMTLQVTGSAFIGALLAPRHELNGTLRRLSVAAWSLLSVGVWLSYYLIQDWATTTNREAFYSVVGCAGMVALYTSGRFAGRTGEYLAGSGGFLGMSMCFGKPTCAVFLLAGMLSLVVGEPESGATRRRRIRAALAGAAACVAFFVLLLGLFGSYRGYLFWCIEIPAVGNKFLWRHDWAKLLLLEWGDMRFVAISCLVVGVGALAWGLLPARAVGLVVAPVLHWVCFCAQGRGFAYQTLPIMATAHTLALVLLANVWELGGRERTLGVLPPLALAFVGNHALTNLEASPFKWNGNRDEWGKSSQTFCDPEKSAGRYIKAHTHPRDTVFAYTPSPRGDNAAILLFYAERRTASPYHYSPWLDPIVLLAETELRPNAKELAALEKLQQKTRAEACRAVLARPPAAVAYVSLDRMTAICPPFGKLLEQNYYAASVIDDIHILLRKSKPINRSKHS